MKALRPEHEWIIELEAFFQNVHHILPDDRDYLNSPTRNLRWDDSLGWVARFRLDSLVQWGNFRVGVRNAFDEMQQR